MEKNLYTEGLRDIGRGIAKIGLAILHSMKECGEDTGKYAYKHPIAILLLIAIVGQSIYSMATARIERDNLVVSNYRQECQIDSLEIMLNIK